MRKVCCHCARQHQLTKEDSQYLGLLPEQARHKKWLKSQGCPRCTNTGYVGREGIIELLNATPKVKKLIRQGKMSELQTYSMEDHFDSFQVAAIDKITRGVTTVEEMRRVIPYSTMHAEEGVAS